MMLASFPITKLIPFPLAGATLFSVMCAVFIGELKLWKTCLIYLPLYFFLMIDSLFSMPQFFVDTATTFGLPIFFRSLSFGFVFVCCELMIMGLSKLFGAKKLLIKIGFFKRLGGIIF